MTEAKTDVYKKIILYVSAELAIIAGTFSLANVSPAGIAAYSAFAFNGLSPAALALMYIATLLFSAGVKSTVIFGSSALVLSVIAYVYKLKKRKIKFELLLYVPLSLVYYIVSAKSLYYSLIATVFITVVAVVFDMTVKTAVYKGFRIKPKPEEIAAIILTVIFSETGLINAFSPAIIKVAAYLVCLILSKALGGVAFIVTCAAGSIPFCIYFQSLEYFAAAMISALILIFFSKKSSYFAGILILLSDYSFYKIFGIYKSYDVLTFSLTAAAVLCYLLLPKRFYLNLSDVINEYGEKDLNRQSINSFRRATSEKLYDIANVFKEISAAFKELSGGGPSPETATISIRDKVLKTVCDSCKNAFNCRIRRNELRTGTLYKLTAIGLAKGKVSFIDIPKILAENCVNLNPLIYAENKEISEVSAMIRSAEDGKNSNAVLLKQTEGIAEMLEKLAFDSSVCIDGNKKAEDSVYKTLSECGIFPYELAVTTEADLKINVVLNSDFGDIPLLEKAVSKEVSKPMSVSEFFNIGNGRTFFTLSSPPVYKAAFGFSTKKKASSDSSGDTHSEILISKNKFLGAVSDGMGSGKTARKISEATLSLIESLYKAGLNGDSVLPLVNKILSLNLTESFSALDLSVIDLNSLDTDFIKFGAPPSFILSEKGIRIIEGDTLPMGVTADIEPAFLRFNLEENDMLIIVSDGISDAFASTGDFIDYIKTVPALNPTATAEEIVKKALSLSGGEAKDDMTALCVRIYKR